MLVYRVKKYFKYQYVNRCRIRNSHPFVLKLVPIDWKFNADAENVLRIDQKYLGSPNNTVSCEVVFSPLYDVYIRRLALKGLNSLIFANLKNRRKTGTQFVLSFMLMYISPCKYFLFKRLLQKMSNKQD